MKEVNSLNAIVFTANVGSVEIKKLLVDNGSTYDILFLNVFTQIGIKS